MIEFAIWLEATTLAQFLKGSRWVYPLVNAGHIFGIALLVGAVVPLDLTQARIIRRLDPAVALELLRPFAIAGLVLSAGFGALLFITQAEDYVRNPVFVVKMGLLAIAVVNAGLHMRIGAMSSGMARVLALLSLALWPTVLLLGRLIGYSIG